MKCQLLVHLHSLSATTIVYCKLTFPKGCCLMPSIVGPVKINSVGGGVVNFGDSFYLSPKSSSKSSSGSGSFNTGDFINTNTGFSTTTPVDPDVSDQNVTANA